jgi:hypothetical protein
MKKLFFGNLATDWWSLSLDDVSVEEEVIAIIGELRTGFFIAKTPMCVSPQTLEKFAAELQELDRTLRGVARLESKNNQSEVTWVLSVNHLGHVKSSGRFVINDNAVDFHFETDQTQLGPLLKWIRSLLKRYYEQREAQT